MPPLKNTYLLMRHGHSLANEAGCIISHPDNGIHAYGLSNVGRAQLQQTLKDWPYPIPDRLLHSDFLRTTESAQCLAQHFNCPIEVNTLLRERCFGVYEQQSDQFYESVWAKDSAGLDVTAEGVESLERVAQRMHSVIEHCEATYADQTLVLVSHGDPLQILLTHLDGRALSEHRKRPSIAPAEITLIQ
ncbi:histidine phosphatase family protein [Nitrincola nitratireducens]|uniref:Phosphoglycerate mutase n=1 Tax=Nitrincola nitratireducens TaxID=1229521 RepID=W9VFH5_9GAMM|nr:histidine phosphatase family protein [Nitrincola nitratireducens]EXJ09425.1 phosphoglycerate mutase [Nitrincola nitratireducens]